MSGHAKALEKPLFDHAPAVCFVVIALRQRPDAMQVFKQHYPSVDLERPAFAGLFDKL